MPRLTHVNVSADVGFKLFGSKFRDIETSQNTIQDLNDNAEDKFYDRGVENSDKVDKRHIWETSWHFNCYTSWTDSNQKWDNRFTLNTITKINLSRDWMLTYSLGFNIEEKTITRNTIKVYRPLHCWEFNFSYFPAGLSSGFSLEIKVKNPKLQDIKVQSSAAHWVSSSYE